MRFLFISKDVSGGDLAWRIQEEGHEVKFYVKDKTHKEHYDGMINSKVDNWRKELDWVGKNGVIVFDHTGFGRIQDNLRKKGYKVVGGSYYGDLLEENRKFGQRIFSQLGMEIVPSRTFYDFDEAIAFVKRNPREWVIKQNGTLGKDFNYVGLRKDGRDVISVLNFYKKCVKKKEINFDLQEKIKGIEIGVGRYFNGKKWVGPIEYNIEYKSLFTDGLGPKTYEMGTVMWYDSDIKKKLYRRTLAKMESYLERIGFRGDFEINFIVTKDHCYPLEATARFGYPALHLQANFHNSPWGDFLWAIANGKDYNLKYNKGMGVIILIAAPPFPYRTKLKVQSSKGVELFIDREVLEEKRRNLHFEEVKLEGGNFLVTSDEGYVMHISSVKEDLIKAQKEVFSIAKKVAVPKMFYRKDIGRKFLKKELPKLKKWDLL